MVLYEIGRVVLKALGREAGYQCVIVDVLDKNFVLVDGFKIRRRRVNVKHLFPTKEKITIEKGAKTEDVKKAIEKAKLKEKFTQKVKIA